MNEFIFKIKNNKNYPWVVVSLLWVVALLNYLDRQMLSTMKPSMEVDIAELQTATNFGYLMAIFLWIYGFMSPISGMIADRINRKHLIIGSLAVWSAVTFSMGYATSFDQLLVLRAVMGVSEALYIPAALSLIAEYHGPKTRSLAIGIHLTGLYMGQALGGFGATVAATYSWQATFQTFGVIGLAYSLILILFLFEKKHTNIKNYDEIGIIKKEGLFKGLKVLFGNVAFLIMLLYFAAPSFPGWALKNWLPTLFSETLNIDMSRAGPFATITLAISSLIGALVGGVISDKWVQKNIRGRIYTSAIGLSLTIPALVIIGFGTSLFHLMMAAVLFGFGFGVFDANHMAILCQFVSSKYRATGYGLLNFSGITAGAFITSLFGKSSDAGNLNQDVALLAGIVLIALVIFLVFMKPQKHDFDEI